MMNPRDRYWALVANGGQARIVEMRRKPYEFRPVAELVSEAQHLTSKDLVSDASGRVYHTQGPGTHAMQPRSDPQETAEGQFARSLADKLDKAANLGRFERLLIVADPRTLGRMRTLLNRTVAARVADEVALDLVSLPPNQLEPRLKKLLGWAA
jgi:protein required for attachment to host cells